MKKNKAEVRLYNKRIMKKSKNCLCDPAEPEKQYQLSLILKSQSQIIINISEVSINKRDS